MTEPAVRIKVDGEIGRISIHRVEKRNAMSLEMWRRLQALVQQAASDAAVKVIVVQGCDATAFASGADIDEISRLVDERDGAWRLMDAVRGAEQAIADCAKPSIAMIRGLCVGGGVEIALACDLRFAGAGARFAIPPARLGLVYSAASTRRLMDLVGIGVARDLLYSGRFIDSAEAKAIGLIEREVPDSDIEAETLAYARVLCARSQYSIQAAKQISAAVREGGSDEDARIREIRIGAFFAADLKEGVAAFASKRTPTFTWPAKPS